MAITNQQRTALNGVIKRINAALVESIKPRELEPVGRFAIDIIVKRTRLGYGVSRNYGFKESLRKLSSKYIKRRQRISLGELTTPKKSNLTLTGQMLRSMDIISAVPGKVVIGPTGNRQPIGNEKRIPTNAEVASYQEQQGRVFNRVSTYEFQQIVRFYRRTFGDLLGKKKLLG
jgi:hypothetical protein